MPTVLASTVAEDLRFAIRSLRKSPGFTLVAVFTLALGIGVNAAIFSLVDGVLLRPLPFEDPERLVHVLEASPPQFPTMSVAYPNFLDWRERNETLSHLAVHRLTEFNLTELGSPELVRTAQVSADLFPMLGVQPALGRRFTEDEDQPGTAKVVLLGHGFWQERFDADPEVLGQSIRLDGEPYEVIGVLPPGFAYPVSSTPPRLWTPIGHFAEDWKENRGNHPGIQATARLAEGVSLTQAREDLESIAAALAEEYPDTNTGNTVAVALLQERLTRRVKPALLMLSGAVLLVLLIACVNVANLLLVRAAGRGSEMAVRSALGAGRMRLLRQLMTESLLLAVVGGLVGFGLAFLVLQGMLAFLDLDLPAHLQVGIDARVLLFTFLAAVGTGVVFGLAPALHGTDDVASPLRDGGRATTGTRGRRLRNGLVVAEVALALVLLVGAGLFLASFQRLWQADPGFDAEGVLTVEVSLSEMARPEPAQQTAFFDQALERLRALPGVVAASHSLPLLGGWQTTINVEGQPVRQPGESISTEIFRVDPQIFTALGLRHHAGRLFDATDDADARQVAVVDQVFVETFWPGENPIGQRFLFGRPDEEATEPDGEGGERVIPLDERWIEVVGVVGHVKSYGVDQDSRLQAYVPAAQHTLPFTNLVIRTEGDPYRLRRAVQGVIQDLDPNQPVGGVVSLVDYVGESYAPTRVAASLLTAFALLATLLAALGIYGVMAYAASQRRHEIGIRLALGADRGSVLRLLVTHGMALAGVGLAVGLLVVLVLGPVVDAQLFEVSPREPRILGASPLLLAVIAFFACALPARRASRADPVRALRGE